MVRVEEREGEGGWKGEGNGGGDGEILREREVNVSTCPFRLVVKLETRLALLLFGYAKMQSRLYVSVLKLLRTFGSETFIFSVTPPIL